MGNKSAYSIDKSLKLRLMDSNLGNDRFQKLLEIFSGRNPGEKKRKIMIEQLSGKYSEETREFLENLEQLREENYGNNRARDFLCEKLSASRDEVNELSKNVDFLLKFMDLQDEESQLDFDDFMLHIQVFDAKSAEDYFLDQELELDNIRSRVKQFVRDYNQKEDWNIHVQVMDSDQGEALKIYSEYMRDYKRTFQCRKNDRSRPKEGLPSLGRIEIFPLKNISVSIENKAGSSKVSFSKNPHTRYVKILRRLFDELFNIEDIFEEMEAEESELSSAIHQHVGEAIKERSVTPDQIDEDIKENADEIVERIDTESEEEEEEIREFLEEAKVVGFELSNDPDTQTDEFRLISEEFTDMIKSIEDIESGLSSLFDQADLENVRVVLQIDEDRFYIDGKKWDAMRGGVSERVQKKIARFI